MCRCKASTRPPLSSIVIDQSHKQGICSCTLCLAVFQSQYSQLEFRGMPSPSTTNHKFNSRTAVFSLSVISILAVSVYSYNLVLKRRVQDSRSKARDFPNPH